MIDQTEPDADAVARGLRDKLIELWNRPRGEHVPSPVFYEIAMFLGDRPDEVLASDLAVGADEMVEDSGSVAVLTMGGYVVVTWSHEDSVHALLRLKSTCSLWPVGLSLETESTTATERPNTFVDKGSVRLIADGAVLLALPGSRIWQTRADYLHALIEIVLARERDSTAVGST